MEVNVFVTSPEGFSGHIKATDVQEDNVVAMLLALSAELSQNGFTGGRGGALTLNKNAPADTVPFEDGKPRPWTKPPAQDVPKCDYCGGAVYDNRENKRNPKGPDFKCKDKTCGAAAWISGAELRWAPPGQG